jgi:hypothetical protein
MALTAAVWITATCWDEIEFTEGSAKGRSSHRVNPSMKLSVSVKPVLFSCKKMTRETEIVMSAIALRASQPVAWPRYLNHFRKSAVMQPPVRYDPKNVRNFLATTSWYWRRTDDKKNRAHCKYFVIGGMVPHSWRGSPNEANPQPIMNIQTHRRRVSA